MKEKLSPQLQEILDFVLASGNAIARVDESPHVAFPLGIVLRESLHKTAVESEVKIAPPVRWFSDGHFAGYVCDDTRQSVYGPAPDVTELVEHALGRLSPNLQAIFDLELHLGNTVAEIDEPAGDLCSLAVIFKKCMHKDEIESTLSLPPRVRWSENRDPHYRIEGGYKCDETGHAILGPLPPRRWP
jgi:hypothetical protein